MRLSRGLAALLAILVLSLPAAVFAQEPSTPPAATEPASPTIAQAVSKAVDDAGKSVSVALADEIHAAEATLAGLASQAILYLAIALCVGLIVGMVLGSVLSSLILRRTIRRALEAAR